jgi:peroxiredoxin Q/BCP
MRFHHFALALTTLFASITHAANIKVGDNAPLFKVKKQDGSDFDLASRKGSWTVLYFYPKAGTPGCTKQACAFRDNIKKVRAAGAEVYGISSDTVAAQAAFHKEHKLSFDLLADPEDKALGAYGTKIMGLSFSKRWTFIIDPELKIRSIDKDVDPALDAVRVAAKVTELRAASVPSAPSL